MDESLPNPSLSKPPAVPPVGQSEFCSTREAAVLLGVSIKTAQLWVETGVLQAWKTPGGHRRIRRESVDTLLRERIPQSPATPVAKATARLKILIVDDDTRLLELYRLTFDSWNLPLQIFTANNGFNGLVTLGEVRPDLLIADLSMPGMNGFRMVSSLRSAPSTTALRVIIVSGLSSAEISEQGGLPNDVEFFSKPVPFEQLRQRVGMLLTR